MNVVYLWPGAAELRRFVGNETGYIIKAQCDPRE
jgi:hypothetical protein